MVGEPISGYVRDPEEWLRRQERRTEELLAKAEEAKSSLAGNTVTQASPDGVVTIRVNPGGGLTGLTLTRDAERMPHAQLASLIMRTYQLASGKAAGKTMEIMSALVGEQSDTLDFLRSTMPEPIENNDVARPSEVAERVRYDDEEGFQGFNGRGDG